MNEPEEEWVSRHEAPLVNLSISGVTIFRFFDGDYECEPELTDLHPAERAEHDRLKVARAQQEYRRSRWLYHRVTGVTQPLLRDQDRVPLWQPPWRGSLSHKEGQVVLLALDDPSLQSVGIDLELCDHVGGNLESRILTAAEKSHPARALMPPELPFRALAFAAKEALFKAHFPIGRQWFSFHDAELTEVSMSEGSFKIRVLRDTSALTPKEHQTQGYFGTLSEKGRLYVVAVCLV